MPEAEDLDALLSLFEDRIEQAFSCLSDPEALKNEMAATETLIKDNWSRLNSFQPEDLQNARDRLASLVDRLAKLQAQVNARLSWVNELNRSLAERVEQST
jgi:ABC-type transporter Mla subunit MlaD